MKRRALLALLVVLGVAGTVAAVGSAVYFLTPQQGVYTGPGIPQTTSGSCALRGDAAWCSQGFVANGTSFNTTMCYTESSTSSLTVWAYLMNQSQYDFFKVNSTLTKLGTVTSPGCTGPITVTQGPGPYYWVWVDTAATPVTVQYSVSVTAET